MAPATTMLYLAHDGSYLLLIGKWWGEYARWFTQLFWVALIFTLSGEVVIFVQTLRYGRAELAPRLIQRRFVALMLVGLVLTGVGWAAVKLALDDDLYLLTFMALIFWAAPLGSATATSQQSRCCDVHRNPPDRSGAKSGNHTQPCLNLSDSPVTSDRSPTNNSVRSQ